MGSNGSKTTVIRNGTLIDGSGSPATENDAIVIEGNRIRNVGQLPGEVHLEDRENVQVIDAAGQWIIPGLIDGHVHLSFGNPPMPGVAPARGTTSAEFSTLRAARNAQKVLRAGFTSMSAPGGTWFVDVAVRDAVKAGLIEGPCIFCAGHFIVPFGGITDNEPSWVGSPEHAIAFLCNSREEMITEVRRELKHGVDYIKLADSIWGDFQALSRDEIAVVVQEAHRRNAPVTIHSRGANSTRDAALAGVDWILHADLDAVAEAGAAIMPSLTFMQNALDMGKDWGMQQSMLDNIKYNVDSASGMLERARKLDIKMLCGTDSGNTPLNKYEEYHANEPGILVTHGGYTPMEAIVACTKNNAMTVGLDGEVGVVGPGKLADILILKGDPLADITVLQGGRNLSTIIKDGRIVDRDRLGVEGGHLEFKAAAP